MENDGTKHDLENRMSNTSTTAERVPERLNPLLKPDALQAADEAAYRAAEDRLIKARRANDEAHREWKRFHFPSQDG